MERGIVRVRVGLSYDPLRLSPCFLRFVRHPPNTTPHRSLSIGNYLPKRSNPAKHSHRRSRSSNPKYLNSTRMKKDIRHRRRRRFYRSKYFLRKQCWQVRRSSKRTWRILQNVHQTSIEKYLNPTLGSKLPESTDELTDQINPDRYQPKSTGIPVQQPRTTVQPTPRA